MPRSVTDWVCAGCGAECSRPPTKGQRPKWCLGCRAKSGWSLHKFTCSGCGANVEGFGSKFCSVACSNRHKSRASRPVKWRAEREAASDKLWAARVERNRLRLAEAAARAAAVAELMEPRACIECSVIYRPQTTIQRFCGKSCARRVGKRERKAREHHAMGSFTWTEVMRLFLLFDRRCAYCEQPIDGQLDPDHVIPLSRGGSNSLTNILPACHPCNGDKRNLLLHEWALDRERRGLPPRNTSWTLDDHRVRHLTSHLVAA